MISMVSTFSRLWIIRVWSPILLVVRFEILVMPPMVRFQDKGRREPTRKTTRVHSQYPTTQYPNFLCKLDFCMPISQQFSSVHYLLLFIYLFIYFLGPSNTFVLCRPLRHVVCREGLLSSTSDSIVNLANGRFACDTSLPHYWCMLVIFCVSPCDSISSSRSVIGNRALCAGSVAGQHCCSLMGLLC